MTASARVAVVVLARAGSSRLPGKMLLPFGDGSVLSSAIQRCAALQRAHELVLATTTQTTDDALAAEARRLGVRVVRGSEEDVVARMLQAVEELRQRPDWVVRACADNPLLMPSVVDAAVDELARSGADLITPFECATLPFGYGLVVMTRDCLERIDREATDPAYREHVENYCFEHPQRFRTRYQVAPDELVWPELCLTLDYPVDLTRLRALAAMLEEVPLAAQPTALIERLRAARVWIESTSTGDPRGHDLVLASLPPPGVVAPRGVVVVDAFEVGGQMRHGLRYAEPLPAGFPRGPLFLDERRCEDSPEEFLARAAPRALPLLLAAPARPIDLLEAAAPPAAKRVQAERRHGFATPAEEAFPTRVVFEHAERSPRLLESLLGELAHHDRAELHLPGSDPESLAHAIERLGAPRGRRDAVAPDPFRGGRVGSDGELEVAGARRPLSGTSIAAFWRSSVARTARARVLNGESLR